VLVFINWDNFLHSWSMAQCLHTNYFESTRSTYRYLPYSFFHFNFFV